MKEKLLSYYMAYRQYLEKIIIAMGGLILIITLPRFWLYYWRHPALTQMQMTQFALLEYSVEIILLVLNFVIMFLIMHIDHYVEMQQKNNDDK